MSTTVSTTLSTTAPSAPSPTPAASGVRPWARDRRRVPALALTALLGLAACGGSTGPSGSSAAPGSTARASATAAARNDADTTFVNDMKPHHEQAVAMADAVLAGQPGREVRSLAQRIKAAQEPEIDQLEALRQQFGADAGHAGPGHGSAGGLMSEQEMTALSRARGPQAERLFLEGMVAHHQGAVEMAEAEIAAGRSPEALALARRIKADQEREIEEMRALLQAR